MSGCVQRGLPLKVSPWKCANTPVSFLAIIVLTYEITRAHPMPGLVPRHPTRQNSSPTIARN